MSDFITLSCPTCGGQLKITEDIERFACAYCGTEHLVKRNGGMVYVEKIIKNITMSMERNTAELAMPRLQKEVNELKSQLHHVNGRISICRNTISSMEHKRTQGTEDKQNEGVSKTINSAWNLSSGGCLGIIIAILVISGVLSALFGVKSVEGTLVIFAIAVVVVFGFFVFFNTEGKMTEEKSVSIQKNIDFNKKIIRELTPDKEELERQLQEKQKMLDEYKAIAR